MIIHAANIRIILRIFAENNHFILRISPSVKYYKNGGAEPFRSYSPFTQSLIKLYLGLW